MTFQRPSLPSRPEKPEPLFNPNAEADAAAAAEAVKEQFTPQSWSLDAEEEAAELAAENILGKLQLGELSELQRVAGQKYLTSRDLLVNPWSRYERLQPALVQGKAWVVEQLKEENKTTEVALARSVRGKKYEEMYALIRALLIRYFMQEKIVASGDTEVLVTLIVNEILGLGMIEALWRDSNITEILVNGPTRTRVEIKGRLYDVPGLQFRDQDHLLEVCQQILAPNNVTLDVANPLQDGSLVDGSRVNAVHQDIAKAGPLLTIRRFPETAFSLRDVVYHHKSMSPEMAELLGNLIHVGASTMIVGGTGSGKTSMLNALSGCIPVHESIIVIEDTAELRLHPKRDVRAVLARKSNAKDGSGAVTVRHLVKNALRQRPNRIVVGEARGFEIYDVLQGMNTGHEGSLTTIHANDAKGGIERLINLLSEGGADALDSSRSLSTISSAVDLFVTIKRYEDGSRRCSGIYEIPSMVTIKDGVVDLTPIPLYEFVQGDTDPETLKVTGHWEKRNDLSESFINKHGINRRIHMDLDTVLNMSDQVEKEPAAAI